MSLLLTTQALKNEIRLDLLRLVYEHGGRLNVSELAARVGVDQPVATIGLRRLRARGLIGARRERRSVYYSPQPDRLPCEAQKLRKVLFAYFDTKPAGYWEGAMMTLLRAFSDLHRLAIIGYLAKHGAVTIPELGSAIGINVKSIGHHLRLLRRAGIIRFVPLSYDFCLYRLAAPSDPLRRALIELALDEERA